VIVQKGHHHHLFQLGVDQGELARLNNKLQKMQRRSSMTGLIVSVLVGVVVYWITAEIYDKIKKD
jgi:hypothetical protein